MESASSAPSHGAPGPAGGDEDPLVEERVVAPVRVACERGSGSRPSRPASSVGGIGGVAVLGRVDHDEAADGLLELARAPRA